MIKYDKYLNLYINLIELKGGNNSPNLNEKSCIKNLDNDSSKTKYDKVIINQFIEDLPKNSIVSECSIDKCVHDAGVYTIKCRNHTFSIMSNDITQYQISGKVLYMGTPHKFEYDLNNKKFIYQ